VNRSWTRVTNATRHKFTHISTSSMSSRILRYIPTRISYRWYDPRDGITRQTELDDHCHKLAADRRMYCQLSSWSTTVQFITHWASTFVKLNWLHVSTIDMPWRNFSSPEFSRNFQTKVPWFYRQQYFLVTPCRTARKKIRVKKRPVTDTSRQTDRQTDRQKLGRN